jgi:methyl-accepting chemotaxis protein
MRRLQDLSLRNRLLAAFGAVGILLLVVAGLGVWGSLAQSSSATNRSHLENVVEQTNLIRYYDADVSGWQISVAFDAHTTSQRLTSHDSSRVAELADKAILHKLLPRFPVNDLTRAEARTFRGIVADWGMFWRADSQIFALYEKGGPRNMAQADQLTNGPALDAFNVLSQQTLALSNSVKARAARLSTNAAATGSTVRMLIGLGAMVALLLAAVLGFAITRTLTRRVGRAKARLREIAQSTDANLKPAIEALAAGDLTVELSDSTASITDIPGDEIGDIMRTGEDLREAIAGCYAAYNQAVSGLRELVTEVTTMASSVGGASEQMAATSNETGRATAEVAHAIEDVARGAERQVKMIETARQAAEDVAAAVEQSAEDAVQTAAVAGRARETADHGVAAAEQANTAMGAVRQSSEAVSSAITALAVKSEAIGAIVETITGIAEQTNLLALNAAIEAARAGEQGRGFAVVAEEVRKLAEESQHAAEEISELISAIQTETADAVQVVESGARKTADGATVVEQTREAFVTIGDAVQDMTARVERIAGAAKQAADSAAMLRESIGEAAAVAEQSSASTQEVSASTEQTSASTEQIASSAAEMASSAETLRDVVGRFQLDLATGHAS